MNPKDINQQEQQEFDRYIASCNLHYAIIKESNGEDLSEYDLSLLKKLQDNINKMDEL